MSTVTVFKMKNWKNHKCSTKENWLNRLWYMHTYAENYCGMYSYWYTLMLTLGI